MSRAIAPLVRVLGVLLCSGCALGEGGFLVKVLPEALSARLSAPAGRFSSDGWLQTVEGFALRLEALELEAEGLTLLGAAAPRLTLTVGGPVPVATRAPTTPLGSVPLVHCLPACGLEAGPVEAAIVPLVRLRARGAVRDALGQRLPEETALALELPLGPDELVLRHRLGLQLDRRAPPQLVVRALIEVPASLADGVDWARLPRRQGVLCLRDAPPCEDAAAAARLRHNLSASLLAVELAPAEP
ncbi:MAG: hypothetical protein NZ890_01950 [Myxococcota bacterium]|nr:hypothetical protein [Myxococcota bacterium]